METQRRPGTRSTEAAQQQTQRRDEDDTGSIASYSEVPRIHAIQAKDIFRALRTFAANTTAHGFYHLNHPVRYFKTGWIVLIIAAFIGITVHLSILVVKFRDEPISTKINPRGSAFTAPDITVCNRMMFAVSKLFNKSGVNESFTVNSQFQPVLDSVLKVREFLEVSVKRYLRLSYGNYEQDSDLLRIEDDGVYNLPNLAIRDTYGVPFLSRFSADPRQMLLSCTYGSIACDYLDFNDFALPTFPSCMTFSLENFLNRRSNISVNKLGELRLVLFTDSSHDSQLITDTLQLLPGDWFNMQGTGGVVVFVHQPKTYPTLGSRIEAPVNRETVVDIRYQVYTSKNTRSNRCTDSAEPLQYLLIVNQTSQSGQFQSELADCYVDVTQKIILQNCGFIDPSLPLTLALSRQPRRGNLSNLVADSGLPPTELIDFIYQVFKRSNVSTAAELPAILDTMLDKEICLRQARVLASNDDRNRQCLDSCQARVYSTSVMPNLWPVSSPEFLEPLIRRWLQSNVFYLNGTAKTNVTVNEDFIQKTNWNLFDAYKRLNGSGVNSNNFLALRFRTGDSQGLGVSTVESFAYELSDLFSDIGGILGLYMGISVLTLCEMAELCLHIVTMLAMLLHRNRTRDLAVPAAAAKIQARKRSVAQLAARANSGFDLEPDEVREQRHHRHVHRLQPQYPVQIMPDRVTRV